MAYNPKTITVPQGGTGDITTTAYAVLCGGTTTTGALQSIAGVGTSGQILTSNGASALPTFQAAPAGGITTIDGNSGSVTGSTVTISTPASSGTLNFSGSSTTLTLNLYDGSDNLAIGASATSTGGNAIAIGHSAGASAANSIVIGTSAADAAGPNNITIGNAAVNGKFASSPSNVVIGHSASASGTANASIAIGDTANAGSAGSSIVIGSAASAVGGSNVVMGSGVVDNGAGASVIIGDDAKGCSGGYNIILGYSAGSSNTTGGSNITISNVGSSGESNVTRIGTAGTGNGQQNKCFIAGINGATPTSGNTPQVVLCDNAGNLAPISSSSSGYVLTSNGSATPSFQATSWAASPVVFNAYLSSNKTNTTGNSAVYKIIPDTVLTNIGSGYDNSTGVFTVPSAQTGVYFFSYNIWYENYTTCNSVYTYFSTSNAITIAGYNFSNPFATATASGANVNGTGTAILSLSAGDTVIFNVVGYNQGSNSITIIGSSDYSTGFGGWRIA